MKKYVVILLSFILIIGLCIPFFATEITLSRSMFSINVGESYTLTVNVGETNINWISSDTNIAVVSSDGVVTGLHKGTAIIYVVCGTFVASATVTVTDFSSPAWGIDVSEHQGLIDWQKIKQSGVSFAIIRLGYGLRTSGSITIDKYFERNMIEAKKAGIDIGVYLYSYAQTVYASQLEAEQVITVLNRYKGYLSYPVWYDFEDSACASTSRRDINTQQIVTFCKTLEAAGYYTGVYTYKYYIENYIDDSKLSSFDHWIAEYGINDGEPHSCSYSGEYGMWQYTSRGGDKILPNCVQSTGLDLNFSYKNYPKIMVNAGLNGVQGAADVVTEASRLSVTMNSGLTEQDVYVNLSLDSITDIDAFDFILEYDKRKLELLPFDIDSEYFASSVHLWQTSVTSDNGVIRFKAADTFGNNSIKGTMPLIKIHFHILERYEDMPISLNISAITSQKMNIPYYVEMNYSSSELVGINIVPKDTVYAVGTDFEPGLVKVFAVYMDGSVVDVSDMAEITGFDCSQFGNKTLKARYKDFDNTADIFVYIPGDVDANGQISLSDAIFTASHVVGRKTFTENEIIFADLNHDGSATLADVILIAKKVLEA